MTALTAADLTHDRDFARALDAQDPLAHMRARFCLPLRRPDDIYFVGNSLGPMPLAAPVTRITLPSSRIVLPPVPSSRTRPFPARMLAPAAR